LNSKPQSKRKQNGISNWHRFAHNAQTQSMFRHFFKIAYRNLLRRKVYSLINIAGLAIGMACCLLITYYVLHEISYDRYNTKADRIYRVAHAYGEAEIKGKPSPEEFQIWGNAPIGAAMVTDFPEIEKLVQFTSPNPYLLQYGDKRFQEENIPFMDSSAFEVFSWKMLAGDPHTALKFPNSIVLTKSIAQKYFGKENPVGKSLKVDNRVTYTVTGLMDDLPSNSHFNFDALISMTTFRQIRPEVFGEWGYIDFYTYFLLKKGSSIESIQKRMPAFVKSHNKEIGYTTAFEPLTSAYLHSRAARQPGPTGSLTNVYIFSCVAVFILLIACINFINLSTARSMERAKEVGVRKAMGVNNVGLIRQFLSESLLISLIAAILSLVIASLALPLIAELSGKSFTSTSFFSLKIFALVILFGLVIGLLSGIYPAFVLSRFQAIQVLKSGKMPSIGGVSLRKALVVFQFTLSIALIAGTAIVSYQLDHIRQHDLGFNQEQMVVIDFGGDNVVQSQVASIKHRLKQHPAVLSATASRAVPGEFLPNAYTEIQSAQGEMLGRGPLLYEIDEDFIPDYKIKMIAGRPYSREFTSDTMKSLIVNEAGAKLFGYTKPADIIGRKFSQWGREGVVIGVVKDFNFRSLHQPVEPLALRFSESYVLNRISLRIKADHVNQTLVDLRKIWNEVAPQRPFLYHFLDESFSKQYDADQHFGNLFRLFAGLAILIACLGLFGLSTFTTEQRTKEIGIRKVLGSSVQGIVVLISKDFVKLILISIVIAIPICWYGMSQWLNNFPYRIDISPLVFLQSGVIAILIAIITISWQSIAAAIANPVDSLRDE